MSMTIISDLNQKPGKHDIKEAWWADNGIDVWRYRLPCGDYIMANDKVYDMLARKKARGIPPKMMDFLGTYDIAIDSKRDVAEVAMDVCGPQHDRFRDELILAQNNGIRLIILVENKPEKIGKTNEWNPMIHTVEDLHKWRNPRLFIWEHGKQKYPRATRGITLQKACMTLQNKYGCTFVFCSPEDAGKTIIELLTK